jgi:threonine synthase
VLESRPAPRIRRGELESFPAGVWRYRAFLPAVNQEQVVTLGEGGTPLLRAERLGRELGLENLLIKDESRNPTGSFMDRGTTVLLSLARERGIKECTCVTTGNLGASLAAYCAKAAMDSRVRVHPNTDQGKLYQMLAYGAEVSTASAKPDQHSAAHSLEVTARNPYLLEGEKTTAFEVVHDLGWNPPDAIVVPVGTGGHLSMIWRAMAQLRESGLVGNAHCRLIGVRVGGDTETGGKGGASARTSRNSPVAELEDSEPYFHGEAAKAISDSGGVSVSTSQMETLRATGLLARTEGIFAEAASASVVASLREATLRGMIERDETVVCIVTGAGLKDPRAVSRVARDTRRVAADSSNLLSVSQIGGTKLSLLQLLRSGPSYGYEMWRKLRMGRGITTASVYQHMEELEALGLVRRAAKVASGGRERVVYDLTRKGTDVLKMATTLQRRE